MTNNLADAVEEAKTEFLYADIFQLIREELSLRLLYLTGTLRPPRSARLTLLRRYEGEVNVRRRLCCRARITFSVGTIMKAFFLANATARTIGTLFPLDFGLERYPRQIISAIEHGQQQMLNMFRCGMFGVVLPSETWRQVLVYTLTCKTLEWMLVHETAHIMSGHIEMPTRLSTSPWVSQLLESQADDFATGRILLRTALLRSSTTTQKDPRSTLQPTLPTVGQATA